MIEAVVWDFGGVFTTSPFEAFNRYEAARGLPHDFIRTVNAAHPNENAWARFERAEITADQFDRLFQDEALALGHDVPGSDVLPLLSGDLRPRVVHALKACKARGLKTGCITNNVRAGEGAGMSRTTETAALIAEVMALFDVVIESSKAGVRKPDPRIYQMMLDAIGVPAAACVYLDDLGINCKPAAALGMHAIKVTGEAQLLADLQRAVGFSVVGG